MNEADVVAAPLSELRDAYRRAAHDHVAALEEGRHRVANRSFDLLALLMRQLRTRGRDGERILAELLHDDELAVRMWAATHSLPFATAAAESVLGELAAGPPSVLRLSAEMTLNEWKAGRMSTD